MVLIIPNGEELCNSLKLDFKTTNNKAYYESVMVRISLA